MTDFTIGSHTLKRKEISRRSKGMEKETSYDGIRNTRRKTNIAALDVEENSYQERIEHLEKLLKDKQATLKFVWKKNDRDDEMIENLEKKCAKYEDDIAERNGVVASLEESYKLRIHELEQKNKALQKENKELKDEAIKKTREVVVFFHKFLEEKEEKMVELQKTCFK